METYAYLGIDVSKSWIDCAYQVQGTWQIERISNEVAPLREWLSQWQGQDEEPAVCIVLEPTGYYHDKVVRLAEEVGIAYVMVDGRKSYHFMQAQGHLHKHDRQAARSLAQMGMEKQLQPSPIPPYMKTHRERKQLQMALNALTKQRGMLKNQLHALAQLYQANPLACTALEKSLEMVETQIQELEQALSPSDEEEVQQLVHLMRSVVGIGPKSVECLLTYLGDFRQFDSHKQVLKFVGVIPGHHLSGSSVRKRARISKQGPGQIRATLYMAARAARKHNHACRELYERLRKRGKPHKVAMIAVVAKLLKQVYAVVTSGVEFDNQYYLKYN